MAGPRRYPPPPTRFGPGALQAKPAMAARLVAPPPVAPFRAPPVIRPPTPKAALILLKPMAAPPFVVQRAAPVSRGAIDLATNLHATATQVFGHAPGETQEVQVMKWGGKFVFSFNGGDYNDSRLETIFANQNITAGGKAIRGRTDVFKGALHAEQNLLKEIAKKLKQAGDDQDKIWALPENIVITGSKRPCTKCRRALTAFRVALQNNYPYVKLHFVDRTGAETGVDILDLDAMAVGAGAKFTRFASDYKAELARIAGLQLSGEDIAARDRMVAAINPEDELN